MLGGQLLTEMGGSAVIEKTTTQIVCGVEMGELIKQMTV